ncbi:MAG: competence/damage-inducible protein A, partial [Thiovulaceae bacterium]|nr:competence/damage-inducible protein A [Sulfurimonadaceae bacterium]
FPQMAHPMIENAIQEHFSQAVQKHRLTLLADTSENYLIHVMKRIPEHIEMSSLPMFKDSKPMVEISLSGVDANEVASFFDLFVQELENTKVAYKLM